MLCLASCVEIVFVGERSCVLLVVFAKSSVEVPVWEVLCGLLVQRPIALVLMMINSCSYSTNDLVFNLSQIFDQDFSRCLASTKDLKSSFGANTC